MYENYCISCQIELEFVLKVSVNSEPTLGQIMAWCGTGGEPLSEAPIAKFTAQGMHPSLSLDEFKV